MQLLFSEQDLDDLISFLIDQYELEKKFTRLELVHDPQCDVSNRENPRAFCFVESSGPLIIHASQCLEDLSQHVRIGILLHEIGHLHLAAFGSDESEVDVDEWCSSIKEAGYKYQDCRYFSSLLNGFITAKNLEFVEPSFVALLGE